jgi:hypothetical protein
MHCPETRTFPVIYSYASFLSLKKASEAYALEGEKEPGFAAETTAQPLVNWVRPCTAHVQTYSSASFLSLKKASQAHALRGGKEPQLAAAEPLVDWIGTGMACNDADIVPQGHLVAEQGSVRNLAQVLHVQT